MPLTTTTIGAYPKPKQTPIQDWFLGTKSEEERKASKGLLSNWSPGAYEKALESAGKVGSVKLGTFDMSPGMLKAAAAGKVEFLIDQQQYLQGYLPIAIFSQYMRYGTMPAGVVMTGPGFVTPKNAKSVIKWAAQGYR